MSITICIKCNNEFNNRPYIDGKRRCLDGRKLCFDCHPFKAIKSKSKTCLNCHEEFSIYNFIDGKKYNMNNRKYCLNCSPFKMNNRIQKHIPKPQYYNCPKCHEHLPYNEEFFYIRKNSNGRLSYFCRKCEIIRTVKNRVKIKKLLIEHFGGECIICKHKESQVSLCFHHIDPSKKEISISKVCNLEKGIKEASKCILICRNCHFEIHSGFYPEYLLNKTSRDKRSENNRQLSKRHETKKRIIESMGGKCCKCGYSRCLASLNFHHLNPNEKEFTIGATFITEQKMLDEAKKCIILCDNCHQIEHYG